jgi:hypothetical protein
MKKTATKADSAASQQITRYIAEVGGWKGQMLGRLREIIRAAGPDLTEEWKWDTPVWSQNGNVVAASAFKDHVKVNFFQGAALPDPKKLFNAGLEAKTTRAIDFDEGDKVNAAALSALVRAAIARNASSGKKK